MKDVTPSKSPHRLEPAFFQSSDTHELIEQLAATDALTIFVGAGISLDRGSLTWEGLVDHLLAQQLASDQSETEVTLKAAQAISTSLGPVAAASAVRELYASSRQHMRETPLIDLIVDDMYKLLYPKDRWSPGGALAEAVVRLAVVWKSLGRDVAILTTNYDNNLEDYAGDSELEDLAAEKSVQIKPFVEIAQPGVGHIPVYHLNGYIPYEGPAEGNLAFSERGLASGTETVGKVKPALDWRATVIEQRLASSTTIFVGTTLRDPTVVNGLLGTTDSSDSHPRLGVFPAQGDAWRRHEPRVRSRAGAALNARLHHLGVRAVRPDYFGQVAQLLNEVVHCRVECDGAYTHWSGQTDPRYSQRLEAWWTNWNNKVRRAPDRRDKQDIAQSELHQVRQELRTILDARKGELVKIELWLRREPRRRELEVWSSSNAANRVDQGNPRGKIENDSSYVAVQAFCQGFALRGEIDIPGSRWRSYFSGPVVLLDAPWHRLPVGVVNLLCSRGETTTCLNCLDDPDIWEVTRNMLGEVGVRLLDPESQQWT